MESRWVLFLFGFVTSQMRIQNTKSLEPIQVDLYSGLEDLRNDTHLMNSPPRIRQKRFIDYIVEAYATVFTGCGFYPSTCEYQRKSGNNIEIIEWVRGVTKYLTEKVELVHPIVKELEKTNSNLKLRFISLFNLKRQVAVIDPLVIRQSNQPNLKEGYDQMMSTSTMEIVGKAFDFLGAAISLATMPLWATNPIGLAVYAVGSTIGMVFRVLGAKNENKQWREFYEKTEREKANIINEFHKLVSQIEKIDRAWDPLKDAMTELGQELGNSLKNVNYETSLEYHYKYHSILKKFMPHIFHFDTNYFKNRLQDHSVVIKKQMEAARLHNMAYISQHCIINICQEIFSSLNILMKVEWETHLAKDAFHYIENTINHEYEHVSEVFSQYMANIPLNEAQKAQLAKRVGSALANYKSPKTIATEARHTGLNVLDSQIMTMISNILFHDRCYLHYPLAVYREDTLMARMRTGFDTPNLRAVKTQTLETIKLLIEAEPDIELFKQLLYNSEGITYTDQEIFVLISYTKPSLVDYKGYPLLPHRYCIEPKHPCYSAVNSLPSTSMLFSVQDNSRCTIKSFNLKRAKKIQETSKDRQCFKEAEDTVDTSIDNDSDPCPDYIEIRGAEQIFSGVYRKTDRKEHGYPVYDGPGDTALSWSHGYWWLSTSSEIGVSDGYAYIGAPMNCPHGPGSLRRGGSDKLIAGATVNDVKINDDDFESCAWEMEVSGTNSFADGVYHKLNKKLMVSRYPMYVNIRDRDIVIAWDGRYNHWWITDEANAGINNGYFWFAQEKEGCPGNDKIVVRRAGTDEVVDTAKVFPLEKDFPLICLVANETRVDFELKMKSNISLKEIIEHYQMRLCEAMGSTRSIRKGHLTLMNYDHGCIIKSNK